MEAVQALASRGQRPEHPQAREGHSPGGVGGRGSPGLLCFLEDWGGRAADQRAENQTDSPRAAWGAGSDRWPVALVLGGRWVRPESRKELVCLEGGGVTGAVPVHGSAPSGEGRHMGSDIGAGADGRVASQLREGVSSQGSGQSVELPGWQGAQSSLPPISRSPSPTEEKAPL